MNKSVTNGKSVIVSCMACGKCSERCPAQIDIMESLRNYKTYLDGSTKVLKKIDEMQSAGKPVDCIECVACSSCCPGRIDVKRFIRELAMMQSCGRLIPSSYGRKRELVGCCVGYVLTFSNGKSVYVTGDTSKTEQMSLMDEMEIDYAFFCCDGVYNMGLEEAAECADLVGAKHNIPYHMTTNTTGRQFDRELAEQFDVENRLIVEDGEEIKIE